MRKNSSNAAHAKRACAGSLIPRRMAQATLDAHLTKISCVEERREAYDAREEGANRRFRFENWKMRDFSSEPPDPETQASSAKTQRKAGVVLGAIAFGLVLVLGFLLARSIGRLNRQMGQLSQPTEGLNRRVEGAEQQAQSFAQQASQAVASAQAAAQQRDEAKQSEANSAAQAQSALQAV